MVEQVIEVIDSDFAQGHLEKLFAAIIDAFTTSPTERLRDVLDKEEQGPRKPSVFFKALKNKVVNMNVSDDVVYDRWLCKLSISIQSAVVGAKALPNMTLDNLLQLADNIYEHLSTTGQQVSAVHHHNNNRNRSHSRDHRHRHHRHRSPSRGRSPSASRYNEGGRWCYNHFTYRDKANKCDTGSDVSVIAIKNAKRYLSSSSGHHHQHPQHYQNWLYAANGTQIRTFGQTQLNLNLGLRRAFAFNFHIAETQNNIIGADFLAQYHLCPDLHARRLLDAETLLSRPLKLRNCKVLAVNGLPNFALVEMQPGVRIVCRVDSKSVRPLQVPKDLFTAEYVYVRKDATNTPLGLLKTGPFKVLSRTADNVQIQTQHGPDMVAWHRTSPAHMDKNVRFNIPRKRGRPRKDSS
ncbi:hypothetical protein TYRP_016704 [Tyrophagus putrescentiae]|nr:hypothetical protein TYRP_016704 [Tyrophagus putrescentiae]